MKKISILHLITAAKNASPFDVNMAFDAGYENIMPYIGVTLNEVMGLTQDAIFSRSPSGIKQEALFFGGRDIHLALDMQKEARSAMFKPFEISTFSDPSGAFTTAAAMVAKVEAHLRLSQQTLSQQTIAIFGASGTVGSTAALIAARQGAKVKMMAHSDLASMQNYVDNMQNRYDVQLEVVDGSAEEAKTAVLQQATVALCAGPAGVKILTPDHFSKSQSLRVVADVNAVPPLGIDGVDVMANGVNIGDSQIVGFGALAIGRLKYVTQHELLKSMLASDVPMHIDYHHAYDYACAHAK
jgi:methylene-tetrahydromethanopterin dehydrogenase